MTKLSDEDVMKAARIYEAGAILTEVAERFEVNEASLRERFDKAGIRRRPRGTVPAPLVAWSCPQCGLQLELPPGEAKRRETCSVKCRDDSMRGPTSPFWKGDDATVERGNRRARETFSLPDRCEHDGCQESPTDRHHIDANPFNNTASNIRFLCRRHHMEEDGRIDQLRARAGTAGRKLTEEDVLYIRRTHKPGGPRKALAARFGVTPQTITDIVNGKTWIEEPTDGPGWPE